ncbi:sugar transporter [Pseudomaricurvus alkylphenolicus]|uniref:MFS transporter n=1 Tax=Pseudomaricurvus alkylphenolicus TaxID=1306991 RepID=UPI0014232151|nr:MFS transporter [Pseudomaricurvus alkylphenolicus]NIB45027.1 sugar transporter [Pseudomaricurvus alkylphenolicus]
MSLSVRKRAIFGAGGITFATKEAAFSTFVLLYYTQVLGLSGTVTGLMLTIGVAWDAISDPMVGMYSDRFSSRWGRRLPIMAVSVILMPLGLIGLFSPPDFVAANSTYLAIWLLGTSIWLRTAMTLFSIPQLAMVPEITQDYHDRSQLLNVRAGLMYLTGGFLPAISLYFLFSETDGVEGLFVAENYAHFGLMSALIVVVFSVITIRGIWGFIDKDKLQTTGAPHSSGMRGLIGDFFSTFHSANFRNLLCYDMSAAAAYGAIYAFNVIAYTYYWEVDSDTLGTVFGVGVLIGVPAGMYAQKFIGRLWPKHQVIRYTLIAAMINTVWLFPLRELDVLPENGHWLVVSLLALQFGGLKCFLMMRVVSTFSLAADLTDELELRTGTRQEGGIYSVLLFNAKLAHSIGPLYGGFALDLIGLDSSVSVDAVPPEVLTGLVWAIVLGSVPLFMLSWLFTFRFSMTQEQLKEIHRNLKAREHYSCAGQE